MKKLWIKVPTVVKFMVFGLMFVPSIAAYIEDLINSPLVGGDIGIMSYSPEAEIAGLILGFVCYIATPIREELLAIYELIVEWFKNPNL
jgi:hypothetical protein